MRKSIIQHYILQLLQEEHAHLTAKEVFEKLQFRRPKLVPSTVYRALEQLTLAGEISVSDMGLGASVYEIVTDIPHHHIVCQECHKIITLEDDLIRPMFDRVTGQTGYEMTTNHLILFGYCLECQQDRKKEE
jgi:Fur family ferric uptake transcriptional regulator